MISNTGGRYSVGSWSQVTKGLQPPPTWFLGALALGEASRLAVRTLDHAVEGSTQ